MLFLLLRAEGLPYSFLASLREYADSQVVVVLGGVRCQYGERDIENTSFYLSSLQRYSKIFSSIPGTSLYTAS